MSEVRHVAHRRAHGRREAAHRWVEVAVVREAVTQRVVALKRRREITQERDNCDKFGTHGRRTFVNDTIGDTVITRSGTRVAVICATGRGADRRLFRSLPKQGGVARGVA